MLILQQKLPKKFDEDLKKHLLIHTNFLTMVLISLVIFP